MEQEDFIQKWLGKEITLKEGSEYYRQSFPGGDINKEQLKGKVKDVKGTKNFSQYVGRFDVMVSWPHTSDKYYVSSDLIIISYDNNLEAAAHLLRK